MIELQLNDAHLLRAFTEETWRLKEGGGLPRVEIIIVYQKELVLVLMVHQCLEILNLDGKHQMNGILMISFT